MFSNTSTNPVSDWTLGLFEDLRNEAGEITGDRCCACGGINTRVSTEMPSMYAGTEHSELCRSCGSSERDSDPFKGTRKVTNTVTGESVIYRG